MQIKYENLSIRNARKEDCPLLEKWWNEFYMSESLRDQLSLPYVLWKNGYSIDQVGTLGNNVYDNTKLQITPH